MADLSDSYFTYFPSDIQRMITEKFRPPDFVISSEIKTGKLILCITIKSRFTAKLFTTVSNKEELLERYKKIRENPVDDLTIFETSDSGNTTQIYLESKDDLLLLLDKLIEYLESVG